MLILLRRRLDDGMHAQQPRVEPLGDALDRAAFARGVRPFEDDDQRALRLAEFARAD